MAKSALLKSCFDLIHFSGAGRVLRPMFQGRGVIFCLHHVCPGGGRQTGFAPNSNLEITPEFLASIIESMIGMGYDLVSLTEARQRLVAQDASPTPFAAFTLDDGYLDNLVHAMPVFARLKCPFTVFVSPRIIDGTCEMWWRILEAVIAATPLVECQITGETLKLRSASDQEKWSVWKRLAPIVQAMPEYDQRLWMTELSARYGIDWQAQCRASAMTWQQLRDMSSNPWAEIGAHTLNHYAVSKLSADDARREIAESGTRLAGELGKPTKHFAFPYGNVDHAGPRDFALCKELGYETALTTRHGVVFSEHRDHLHALPRIMVSGKFQKARYIEALTSGLTGAMSNGFRRVNAG